MTSLGHLARRFAGSLSHRPPSEADASWAVAQLLPAEAALWQRMAVQDKRHSILVTRRFVYLADEPSREQTAAALLHDVGKLASGLGTCARVLATIVGPRTARFRQYHDHERLGAEMLRAAGSAAATLELVQGAGPAAAALRQADDI